MWGQLATNLLARLRSTATHQGAALIANTVQVVADAATAATIPPTASRVLLIRGSDGGIFEPRTGAAQGTYASDGEGYAGSVIAYGDGSAAWVRQDVSAIDPRWYGAAIDGTTDDTSAINAALSAAHESGVKRVMMPAGTAMVTSLQMRPGITLEGAGRTETTIKQIQGATDHVVTVLADGGGASIAANAPYAAIRHLEIDGDKAGTLNDGIHVANAKEDPDWNDLGYRGAFIGDVEVHHCTGNGVYIGIERNASYIEAVRVTYCTENGIEVNSANDTIIGPRCGAGNNDKNSIIFQSCSTPEIVEANVWWSNNPLDYYAVRYQKVREATVSGSIINDWVKIRGARDDSGDKQYDHWYGVRFIGTTFKHLDGAFRAAPLRDAWVDVESARGVFLTDCAWYPTYSDKAQNLALHSEDLSNPWWIKANCNIESAAVTAMGGRVTLDRIYDDVSGVVESQVKKDHAFLPATTYRIAAIAKAAERDSLVLGFDGQDSWCVGIFNLTTGEVETGNTTWTVERVRMKEIGAGTGEYYCEVVATTDGDPGATHVIVRNADNTGDGVSGLYVGALQFSEGASNTGAAYLKTTDTERLEYGRPDHIVKLTGGAFATISGFLPPYDDDYFPYKVAPTNNEARTAYRLLRRGESGFYEWNNHQISKSTAIAENLYYDDAWKHVGNGYGAVMQLEDGAGVLRLQTSQQNAAGEGAAATLKTAYRVDMVTDTFEIKTQNLQFGTYTPLATETLAGYIELIDSTGTPRKVAVVA